MTRTPPKVGQIVYSLNVGNAARGVPQKLTPMTVIAVGRKYFTANEEPGRERLAVQFHLDNWREKSQYVPEHRLYASIQEYDEERESYELCNTIRKEFSGYTLPKIPLEGLRKIVAIMKGTP